MDRFKAIVTALALAGGTSLAACDSHEENAREERQEQLQEREARTREAYEEWAEGRAETEAALRGAGPIEQELAGSAAEEQMDEVFDQRDQAIEDTLEHVDESHENARDRH
jgi:hypothetical protein